MSEAVGELRETSTHDVGAAARTRASLREVLAAPWLAIVRPRRAGAIVARAGGLPLLAGFGLMVLTLSAEILALLAWGQTCQYDYVRTITTGPQGVTVRVFDERLRVRSVGQVLSDWVYADDESPLWVVPIAVASASFGMACALTLCLLPRVYRGGRLSGSLGAAAKVPWVAWASAAVAIVAVAVPLIVAQHRVDIARHQHRRVTGEWLDEPGGWPDALRVAAAAIGALAAVFIVLRLDQIAGAVGAAGVGGTAEIPEPRCGGCGYSLRHVPADGRCPECGTSTDKSLSPDGRPGLTWEQRGAAWLGTFAGTAGRVLFRPSRAYAAMRTRGDDESPWCFERRIVAVLGGLSMVLTFAMWVSQAGSDERGPEMVAAVVCGGIGVAFGGWALNRIIGGVAVGLAAVRGDGADARSLARAVGYESAFLVFLVVFGFGMGFVLSFGLDGIGRWVARFGLRPSAADDLTLAAMNLGYMLLFVLWCVRYRIAYRAVRWANF